MEFIKIIRTKIILLIIILSAFQNAFAQFPPNCDEIYYIKNSYLYSVDPSQPNSSTNPTKHTIKVPFSNSGFTISENINNGSPIQTFYVVDKTTSPYSFAYYDGSDWVNTGHSTGNSAAVNLGAGGGYIYNLVGRTGQVYRYDGSSDAVLIATVSDFQGKGPYDLIADCLGNWYILDTRGKNWLRKYNSEGVLLKEWKYDNPKRYDGHAGFGIIGNNIYFDDNKGIVTGTLTPDTLIMNSITSYTGVTSVGDLATCGGAVTVYPNFEISSSDNNICPGTQVTFTGKSDSPGPTPSYRWFVNSVPMGTNSDVFDYYPKNNDTIWCIHNSSQSCVSKEDVISKKIVITHITSNAPSFKMLNTSLDPCSLTNLSFEINTDADLSTVGFNWYLNGVNQNNNTQNISFLTLQEKDVISCEMQTSLVCNSVPIVFSDNLMVSGKSSTVYNSTICNGDFFIFNGKKYTDEGIYSDTLKTTFGCDSILILDLIVDSSSTTYLNASICSGDKYNFGGTDYTKAGIYTNTLPSANNCDSIVILDLAVTTSAYDTLKTSICKGNSFSFNNIDYSLSGVYSYSIPMLSGCDSILTLDLQVNDTFNIFNDVTICSGESFEFNGIKYSQTGLYKNIYQTQFLCDSTVNINLHVLENDSTFLYPQICEGESFFHDGITYTNEGVFTKTYSNTSGCDSIVVLDLKINSPYIFDDSISICKGDTLIYNSNIYTEKGTYTFNYNSQTGCDSIINLHLTTVESTTNTIKDSICKGSTYKLLGKSFYNTGIYNLTTINSNGCDSLITLNLEVNLPTESVSFIDLCKGQSYLFNNQNITESGSYSYKTYNVKGCDSTAKVNVKFIEPKINHISRTICENDNVSIEGNVFNKTGVYEISIPTGEICDSIIILDLLVNDIERTTIEKTICKGDVFTYNNVDYSKEGDYTINLSSIYNCDSIITLMIHEDSGIFNPHILGETQVCENSTFDYHFVKSSPNNKITYSLASNDEKQFVNYDSPELITWKNAFSDTIIIEEINENGCIGITSIPIDILPYPNANYNYTTYNNGMVDIYNQSTLNSNWFYNLPEEVNYFWNWGLGNDSLFINNEIEFSKQFQFRDQYVSLHAINQFGCETIFQDTISVEAEFGLYVPSAFAPDNPALGVRTFKPKGFNLKHFEIYVFDNWGNIIWYSNKINSSGSPIEEWDGTYNGNPLDQGSYVWKIKAVFIDGTIWTYKGNVNEYTQFGNVNLIR